MLQLLIPSATSVFNYQECKSFKIPIDHGGTYYIPGLQSVRREQTESRTLETVNAGLQLSLRMSKQMIPWLLMLQ